MRYTRLHALTKADNLGVALVVIGLLPQMDGVLAGAEAGAGVAAGDAVQCCGVAAHCPLGAAAGAKANDGESSAGSWCCCCCGLALWTVVARDAFLAVAGFVVYGLLLSLVWVRLAGIDVAH